MMIVTARSMKATCAPLARYARRVDAGAMARSSAAAHNAAPPVRRRQGRRRVTPCRQAATSELSRAVQPWLGGRYLWCWEDCYEDVGCARNQCSLIFRTRTQDEHRH